MSLVVAVFVVLPINSPLARSIFFFAVGLRGLPYRFYFWRAAGLFTLVIELKHRCIFLTFFTLPSLSRSFSAGWNFRTRPNWRTGSSHW